MPATTSHRPLAVVVVLVALLSGLLLAPTASFGEEGSGAIASDLVIREEALTALPEVSAGSPGQAEAPFPITAATPVSASCPDLLVTLTPESPGDGTIVVFPAQSIDRDLGGWANVSWEPAPGATIREVLAVGIDGSVTALPGGESGIALDVRSLTFCGTFDPPAPPSEPAPEPEPEPAPDTAPPAAGPSPGGGSAPSQGGSSATGQGGTAPSATAASDADTAPASDDAATSADDADAALTDDVPGTEDEDLGALEGDTDDPADQPETEVLGVQLTREQDSAPVWAWALAAALFGLLVTGGYRASRQP